MSALIFAGALLFSPPPIAATDAVMPMAAPPLVATTVEAFTPGDAAPTVAPAGVIAPQTAPAPETPESAQRDIVVTGRSAWEAPDPFADINTKAFEATMAVDSAIIGPIAMVYKDVIPKPIRDGAHNFLYNLREPVVFLNFVLQLKIGRALETVGRFAINTTVGVAGLFDMAKRKPFKWRRRSNGFANTLGFYGIKTGPFMFLPIVGPTTPRDLIGGALDRLLFPFVYGSRITKPEFAIPFGVIGMLDHRAEFDDTQRQLHDGQADPYARSRDFYLQRRQNEIDELKGKAPKNSSGMSEAPTAPITVRERSGTTLEDPAPIPTPPVATVPQQ
ncbi:MlaA family lipoprotein [Sphingomonas radiodurans]|uniref:MlaA family lipoprotein n=1 Tax=Sphingomonas radiodurans TaxID=2890321 RepID=UPI001E29E676|nr:VacJ family lipoprotein [Sphingomonas radiodurans]WBH17526.1 VacJ family lipoprotein [Sphingomonas radiodurans]